MIACSWTKKPGGHKDTDFLEFLNPDSLKVLPSVKIEPALRKAKAGQLFQFLRLGYFCVDPDTSDDQIVFNRTVTLRDTWAKGSVALMIPTTICG